jgi:hypothetical protein
MAMAMASCDAQIHMMNLMAAAWFAQKAFERLFKEAELASSTEYAMCAANAEGMEMPASLPLKTIGSRHGVQQPPPMPRPMEDHGTMLQP